MRRSCCIHINRVARYATRQASPLRSAGVWIDVKVWKVAGGDIQSDAVAAFEQVRGRKGDHLDGVNHPGSHQRRVRPGLSVTAPENTVGEIQRIPPGVILAGRIDVDQLDREIGIHAVGADP